jgi:hypothetical protein
VGRQRFLSRDFGHSPHELLGHHEGAGDGGSTNASKDGGAGIGNRAAVEVDGVVGDGAAVVVDGVVSDGAAMEVDGGTAGTRAATGLGERGQDRERERGRVQGLAMGARESLSMGGERGHLLIVERLGKHALGIAKDASGTEPSRR